MPRKKARIENDSVKENQIFNTENQENNGVEITTVLSLFRECEDSHAHDRLISEMKINFYDKLNIDQFSEDFFNCCRFILSIEDRKKADTPLKFVVKFVIFCLNKATDNNDKEISLKLAKRFIKFITWYHDVQQAHVRLNVIRAIKILLNELTDEIEIPDVFYEKIQEALLKRFFDIKSFIRAEAAAASSRLQAPSDAACVIVMSLIHLCTYDSSHIVRSAAMQALAVTTKTLPVIITRCRDINDNVRCKSYELLIKWKILKPLKVSKRLQIMEIGLTDKSEIVREASTELLKVWFNLSNDDPIALLKRLDVENMEESTELTLTTLFQRLNDDEISAMVDFLCGKMDERHLVCEEHICSEMAFFWKHLAIFLNDKQPDKMERIIPQIVDFELYIRRLFIRPMEQIQNKEVNLEECVESYTIIKHLLPIVKFMDVYDEHNRQKMIEMIKWSLSSPNVPFNYVEHLMKLLVHLESNNEKICNITVELINDLLYSDVDVAHEISEQQSLSTVRSSHHELPVIEPVIEPVNDQPTINTRKVKMELASVGVRINELNESISNLIKNKQLDKVKDLVDVLKEMEQKKSDLDKLLQTPIVTEPITNEIDIDIIDLEVIDKVKTEAREKHPWMDIGMEHKIIKANVMTIAMIQECKVLWVLPSSLRALFEDVIKVSIQHPDLCVRQKAIMSMGLCCLLDKDLAIRYYKLFIQSLEIDHESVKEITIKSLIDIFIRFGIEPFQEAMMLPKMDSIKLEKSHLTMESETSIVTDVTGMTEEEYNKCTTELMTPIIDLLNSKNSEMQTTVAIGLSKLIYNHKLMSSKLLSRLILLWFNPITEDNLKLRQHLAAFFANFSLMSADNQESIMNCFLITMRTLFKAPADSPLSEIDINNVISFFERIVDSRSLIDNRTNTDVDQSKLDNPCHDNLAIIISNQILNAPLSMEVKYYVPMLLRLRLSPNNIDLIKTLQPMVAIMINKVKDKKSMSSLEKLNEAFDKLLQEAETNQTLTEIVNDPALDDVMMDVSTDAPVSIPSLLEMGIDGKKMNDTYLGGRVNKANIEHTVNQMSSISLDDNCDLDATLKLQQLQSFSSEISTNMPPPDMSGDEKVFKKPKNVRVVRPSAKPRDDDSSSVTRVTRSNPLDESFNSSSSSSNTRVTRSSSSLRDSSISSINSDVTTSTRYPRRASLRKK